MAATEVQLKLIIRAIDNASKVLNQLTNDLKEVSESGRKVGTDTSKGAEEGKKKIINLLTIFPKVVVWKSLVLSIAPALLLMPAVHFRSTLPP